MAKRKMKNNAQPNPALTMPHRVCPLGETRTHVATDHAFIASDSHVSSALPGWYKTMGIILISPRMGADFCQYYADMERGGKSALPQEDVQRFGMVLNGEVSLQFAKKKPQTFGLNDYFYIPPGIDHEITACKNARLVIFEKPYHQLVGGKQPSIITGNALKKKGEPFLGDPDALLANLLPDEPEYDMAMNYFTFQPGAMLPFVEVHIMEHGLLMTEGGGVYRLSERWYPCAAGDVIWMAPYCPQWFMAGGKTRSAYLYYKDVNRDPLDGGVL